MKTSLRLLINLAGIVILLSALKVTAQENTAFYTVSGIVKDKQTGEKLEYAAVSAPGANVGTVTNNEGKFTLKILKSSPASTIEISHLGYLNYRQPLHGENVSQMTFELIPTSILLPEASIFGEEAKAIVAAAIDKIGYNYTDVASMLTCFHRETIQKQRKYIDVSEAILYTYKTPYTENTDKDRVQIYKGRHVISQKAKDTLIVKLAGGPNLPVYSDVVKNPDLLLDKNTLDDFSYSMQNQTTINNRPQYVITFSPRVERPYPLYRGTLYIDKENLSFTKAEFFLDMTDRRKVTQLMVKSKPARLRFKPVSMLFLVTYIQRDGKTYLNYLRNEIKFKCDWKRRLFSTDYTITSEAVVTESRNENVAIIPNKSAFKKNQILSDKVQDFSDENFWGAYNIIEPTESLESGIIKLKKQYK